MPTHFARSNRSRPPARRDSLSKGVARKVVEGMVDGFWLDAWASALEEAGRGNEVPRHITRETAEPAPRSAHLLARQFASVTEKMSRASITQLYERAVAAEGGHVDPYELGFDLAMQARGHGVGWTDDHEPFEISFPSAETYAIRHRGRWILEGYVNDERFPHTLRDPSRRTRAPRRRRGY